MKRAEVLVVLLLLFLVGFFPAQNLNYYFGNLHSHTAFSDGNKDSASSGVNNPAGSYAYAKLSNDFDFLGISEHNHFSSNKNPGFKLPRYQEGLNMATAANDDGNFVSLFGMEYGVSSNNNGHVIIYGFNQLIGWEVGVGGNTGPNYDIYNAKTDYAGLFKKVRNNPASFAYLAHPWWTDFSLQGTDSSALAFSAYNAQFDSALVAVPLRSGNAFSTFADYSDYMPTDHFNYFKKLLNVGYHIGMGYDHDNHNTNFGRSNGGRLVVLMPSLTKQNLFSAMQQMHFYGSDDSNVKIDFKLNGNIMGSVFGGNDYPQIEITHTDPDGEKADTIRIWKGYKNSFNWATIIRMETSTETIMMEDKLVYPGTEYYYFADIRQKDGQWIVTSPIWYRPGSALGVQKQTSKNPVKVFPNPCEGTLYLSSTAEAESTLIIKDILGKEIKKISLAGSQHKVDLDFLERGIYLLEINTADHNEIIKLVKN